MLMLAVPVILAEQRWMSMSVVDTIMVGHLGPAAIGATGVGSSAFYSFAIFGMAYQAGMQHFQQTGAKVFGISTDNSPSQKVLAEQLALTFPVLSDFLDCKVSQQYRIYIPKYGIANRVTL